MEMNESAREQLNNKIAEMRKNPKLVDAALGLVARIWDFYGDGTMVKEICVIQREVLNLFICEEYPPKAFDEPNLILEFMSYAAAEIDEAYFDGLKQK